MGTVRSFRDLIAWQKAKEVALDVYRVSSGFPSDERFGLTSQIRRAVVSIPSNIAEGFGRGSTADYVRFLRVARASLCEVETQMIIASELGFIPAEAFNGIESKLNECGKVLAGLLRSLETQSTDA